MLDLEFLGAHDGPFDFIKGQLKLNVMSVGLGMESQGFAPATFECRPHQR